MNADIYGEGRLLILVPGLGCDGRMWGPVLDALGPGYRIIVPHAWEAASMADAAKMTADAVAEAGGGPALFAGLSMGGYVVMETIRRYPEIVVACALLDTTAYPDDAHRREKRLQVLKLIADGKFGEVREAFIRTVLWSDGPRFALCAGFLEAMCEGLGAQTYARSLTSIMERGGYEDVLAATDKPLLFLAGAHDQLTPPALAARMAAEAKNAQAYEIPDAAHMSAVENPAAVAYALGEFFDKCGGK